MADGVLLFFWHLCEDLIESFRLEDDVVWQFRMCLPARLERNGAVTAADERMRFALRTHEHEGRFKIRLTIPFRHARHFLKRERHMARAAGPARRVHARLSAKRLDTKSGIFPNGPLTRLLRNKLRFLPRVRAKRFTILFNILKHTGFFRTHNLNIKPLKKRAHLLELAGIVRGEDEFHVDILIWCYYIATSAHRQHNPGKAMTKPYGDLNAHAIGIIMKELVRRAIEIIRAERSLFEATTKHGHSGEMDDVVTSADKSAQRVYVKLLNECFPLFGIIAEEDGLRKPCQIPGRNLYFTVDPLDGTKAYVRRQSHGIGTMIALVDDGQVIAAYVGDVMTREIYGYRPESDRVWRISEYGKAEELAIDPDRPLKEQYLLLRDGPETYSPLAAALAHGETGICRGMEVSRGSIGIHFARLWKGEVGATILLPGMRTPWDETPLLGISHPLGFRFVQITADGEILTLEPFVPHRAYKEATELIVLHKSRLNELENWLPKNADKFR